MQLRANAQIFIYVAIKDFGAVIFNWIMMARQVACCAALHAKCCAVTLQHRRFCPLSRDGTSAVLLCPWRSGGDA